MYLLDIYILVSKVSVQVFCLYLLGHTPYIPIFRNSVYTPLAVMYVLCVYVCVSYSVTC